ncbi:hypothetical protein [Ralstonia mannitolilytica]|uniref:hypothetical protein n=1 Tax=Ralstonia mannitolilytica TaxID=105219 RepID=UPI0012FE1196|nr:hypothetical protein [Ralstonia mannitolilytica]
MHGTLKKNHTCAIETTPRIRMRERGPTMALETASGVPSPGARVRRVVFNSAAIAAVVAVPFSCTGKRRLVRHAGFVDGAKPHALKLHN